MRSVAIAVVACILVAITCVGAETVTIEGELLVNTVTPDTRIVVHTGAKSDGGHVDEMVLPNVDGKFEFDVPRTDEAYIVSVASKRYRFESVRVTVCPSCSTVVRASVSNDTMSKRAYPLLMRPVGDAQFLVERTPYNWLSLFKNPMLLMMLVMGGMGYIMPKLMENMDEEAKREAMQSSLMRAQQQGNQVDMLDSMSSWLSGASSSQKGKKKKGKKKSN